MIKKNEDDIICDAIGERTFQAACDWFNENLPDEFKTTRQSVYNWVVGKHAPDHNFLNALVIFYAEGDERRMMAEKLLEMRREKMLKVRAHWLGQGGKKPEAEVTS